MFNVTHNAAEVIDRLNRFTKQGREATARALTMTAKDLREALPKAMEADLDKPTPFTLRGFYLKAATASTLQAEVGILSKQAAYLKYQAKGGSRAPTKVALRLPSVVSSNQYGNLPAGVIKQLIARAKKGKRTTKRQAKRSGVSQGLDLFYGDPKDGRPAGIYKRVVISSTRHVLVPVVMMPKQSASYRQRFDFFGRSQRVVLDRWPPNVSAALARALSKA